MSLFTIPILDGTVSYASINTECNATVLYVLPLIEPTSQDEKNK
jgi:hypothetical protein